MTTRGSLHKEGSSVAYDKHYIFASSTQEGILFWALTYTLEELHVKVSITIGSLTPFLWKTGLY